MTDSNKTGWLILENPVGFDLERPTYVDLPVLFGSIMFHPPVFLGGPFIYSMLFFKGSTTKIHIICTFLKIYL